MTPAATIAKKRDGRELARGEIAEFVAGYERGAIPDYQMAALAMAIFLKGMTTDETAALTDAMLDSGVRLTWPAGHKPIVDKHSTGGIGDKTSLVLAPLLACCGLAVPMISGRGLGATGGTIDKLEAIPGFRTDLSIREIEEIVGRVGCVITGASSRIAPADRKLYALRDVTATVPSIPLITASIMSKKLAESLDALVLDVKFGSGAFMKSVDLARMLARSLVDTGQRMGVKTSALLTDMNQPLGRMAGNLVEVHEAIACLKGEGPKDLWEVTRALALEVVGDTKPRPMVAAMDEHVSSGRAMVKFAEMVEAQGGDLNRLPPLPEGTDVVAEWDGFVADIDAEALGQAIIELGGGRKVMTDKIDHGVGLEMKVRLGDLVESGQPLVRVFASAEAVERVKPAVINAFQLHDDSPKLGPLVVERVG
jgi:pyrimidine-nucleoside phosphorylase